jgi:hypothetical protein
VRMSATNYSPVDPHGPFAPFTPTEEGQDFAEATFHGDRGDSSHGNEALAQAAQNLPGSLLPPAAIAELRGAPLGGLERHHADEDHNLEEHAKPPPLPSYANKPYLSMLSEDEGREGTLPGRASPPRARASGGRDGRPESSSDGNKPLPPVPGTGGPRSSTRDSTLSDADWPTEALLHMGIGAPPGRVKRKEVQR